MSSTMTSVRSNALLPTMENYFTLLCDYTVVSEVLTEVKMSPLFLQAVKPRRYQRSGKHTVSVLRTKLYFNPKGGGTTFLTNISINHKSPHYFAIQMSNFDITMYTSNT
jgi:hypothetical protein